MLCKGVSQTVTLGQHLTSAVIDGKVSRALLKEPLESNIPHVFTISLAVPTGL